MQKKKQQQQYRSSKPQPELVNPLTPRSDQYETSPSDILTLSCKRLMRISGRSCCLDLITTSRN